MCILHFASPLPMMTCSGSACRKTEHCIHAKQCPQYVKGHGTSMQSYTCKARPMCGPRPRHAALPPDGLLLGFGFVTQVESACLLIQWPCSVCRCWLLLRVWTTLCLPCHLAVGHCGEFYSSYQNLQCIVVNVL